MQRYKRFFNTAGVIDPKEHYFLPHRLDWDQLEQFIERNYYFVIRAPRQSGKTIEIIEFVRHLNEKGQYRALYLSVESAQVAIDDVKLAVQLILEQFNRQIRLFLPSEKKAISYLEETLNKKEYEESGVYAFLRYWAEVNPKKPLVICFDGFNLLTGDSLIALLAQIRTGYTNRPEHFPQTICFVGVRGPKNYKKRTKEQEDFEVFYSPFNIIAESVELPDFSLEDIKTLYGQHTEDTGQIFADEAIAYAFEQTQGQPWLVNALAYQACFRDVQDHSIPITKEVLEKAREALINRCDTHLDGLLDRLNEPRVRDVIDALISGGGENQNFQMDDLQYVRDLGLISPKRICIVNPIYQEIIPRALAYTKQESINQELSWYQKKDGSLDVPSLLEAFTQFYRENSEVWLEEFAFKESGPHLFFLAFLQRIIDEGGTIQREYGLGTKRVDLLIVWKKQKIVIELKVKRQEADVVKGLTQAAEYMDKSGATEGYLVVFDRNAKKSWEEKISRHSEKVQGKTIEVFGM